MRFRATALAVLSALGLGAGASGCSLGGGSSGSSTKPLPGGTVRGAGASAPSSLYAAWANRFHARTGLRVRYQPAGSGAGIVQFLGGGVDFGASDAPLNAAEIAAATESGVAVHVPVAIGALAVAYRVAGVPAGLKLDAPVLADILLGHVRRWNAGAIARLNPGVALPATPITVVHRSDNAGATRLLTAYLSAGSPSWAQRVGSDKAVAWGVGAGAVTSAGVAREIARRQGAIGYLGAADAHAARLSVAALRNRAGAYTIPSQRGIAIAARHAPLPADLRLFTVARSADPGAYPIASPTYALVYHDVCEAGVGKADAKRLGAWLRFVLGDAAQRVAARPGFAPLPHALLIAARGRVNGLLCNGQRVQSGSQS